MTLRQDKVNHLLRDIASSFIKSEFASLNVLVTVTRADVSEDSRSAKIFVSVYPEEKEKEIFDWLNKKTRELNMFVKSRIKMRLMPKIFFDIDKSAKIERRIEELLKK